jgi:hypothetical protein
VLNIVTSYIQCTGPLTCGKSAKARQEAKVEEAARNAQAFSE